MDRPFRLDEAVADVYGDLRLAPVLRRLLRHTGRLTGSVAGSVSLIDADRGCYVKVAEYGAPCQLGRSFPLDEGATGRAFGSRRPVVIPEYGRLRAGHLAATHPARHGPAAAVPIWWRGDVIAVSVAFAPAARTLSARGVDELEALTQSAAAAIVESGRRDPSPAALIRRRCAGGPGAAEAHAVVTEVGVVRPVSPEVARVAADLVADAGRAAARRRPDPRLHVALVYRPQGLRVLVQDETTGTVPASGVDPLGLGAGTWDELLRLAGGGVSVEQVTGWGVLVRADVPYSVGAPRVRSGPAPFTPREAEVLELLRQGLTYREMAGRLGLSTKTVEKHVGAIMRKTGTSNRTAAVVTALDNNWMGNLPHTATRPRGS
ncbi:LuxR C-terminal-related transcriptional regulator [Actinoplanes sp. NPDC049599]|uniref:LuxR C-terminal-related transcriptional regulator n=1 Tax=Actinoplanes sp. NPDC049599 TaxID=3363903 RepID=UPI00379C8972